MAKQNIRKLLLNSDREYKCECCGNSGEWCNKELVLEIHHIDGDKNNNVLSNLKWLCPNCHSQTDNFRSKNRKDKLKEKCYCKVCGKELSDKCDTGLCVDCYRDEERKKSKKPEKEILIQDCNDLRSYSAVSKKYGVSAKTITKWCKSYGFTMEDLGIKPYYNMSDTCKIASIQKNSYHVTQLTLDNKYVNEYYSVGEAERQTGIAKSNILRVLRGERKQAGGFKWIKKEIEEASLA